MPKQKKEKTLLQIAKDHYLAWCEAEIAVANGQEYTIGSRRLRRADLSDILAQIKYWRSRIDAEEAAENGRSRGRVYRVIPRDI